MVETAEVLLAITQARGLSFMAPKKQSATPRDAGVTLIEMMVVLVIIAVIAATGGEASIAVHLKNGFVEVGRTPAVGYKFDQWIDCVYLQRSLG